jgi:Ni,Fe-hydrogenase III large subunit/Ni,Fe-hydrogenase III component G
MSIFLTSLERLLRDNSGRAEIEVKASTLVESAALLLDGGFRLALVAADDRPGPLRLVYLFASGPPDQRVELCVSIDRRRPTIPSLAAISFSASRFEREIRDLYGIEPEGHPLSRRLVLHQHWPIGWHPMRRDAGPMPPMIADAEPYPFVEVEGPGIYEIPVGPIHAGVIEPGHFRFSVVGETIVKMKARLWFVHKGIEKLFEGKAVGDAVELAEKVSGDTAVGHSLAYCLAVEEACGIAVPQRAQELRSILLELERLYNHVADVGALCNDVGFGLVNARALVLREQLLRLNAEVTGHRLLRGGLFPGGVVVRRLPRPDELDEITTKFVELVNFACSNSILMDRFSGTAVLTAEHAAKIGVLGVVGRASGLTLDARVAHPLTAPPAEFEIAGRPEGDVLARFRVRCDEVASSALLIDKYAGRSSGQLSAGSSLTPESGGHGSGIVEGFRGSIVHRVDVDDSGKLLRAKVVDPSFLNWPALAVALTDTIVPDFPLTNKSFGLSYAGNDL